MAEEFKIIGKEVILGKEFTVYDNPDRPLFLMADVATWIGHDVSSLNELASMLDREEKVLTVVCTLGENQPVWFLTEFGIYEILFQSSKPFAKEFRKGMTAIFRKMRKVWELFGLEDGL